MIDLKQLRENPQFFRDAAQAKNVTIDIDRILEVERRVRSLKTELEGIKAQKNEASKEIAKAEAEQRTQLIEAMRHIDRKAETLETEYAPLAEELSELLFKIPNPALADVKVAPSEDDNEVVREVGAKTQFSFTPKDHQALGEYLGIIDTERATKVSGSRFVYFLGDGALLEFALVQYAMSIASKHGFLPATVPHLVSAKVMRAMGYLEHGGHDEIYYLAKDNLYLIGTAEQSLGALHMDETLEAANLPLRYVGYSPCYRREAGSYGKDTRGIIRVHQFSKIEMFSYTTPETSDAEHELLLSVEEELMQGLGLPYRVIKQCTGDLGLPAARKYDIEAWIPTQDTYRETHSTSTCTDFQARRLNTRYKDENGETRFVHTLNGTAFAVGRTLVAILENNQREDGSVAIPAVLQPFMAGKTELKPRS
ncbi:MAG: serine--tRNA ligase [Patescibacteria group bacterium]